jgi:short-subunit dehydrogenase
LDNLQHPAHYAATKAYGLSLGEALHEGFALHGIDVCISSTGRTDTGFGKRSGMRLTDAESAAMGRRSTVVPGTKAKIPYVALMTAATFLHVQIMKAAMAGVTLEMLKNN